MKLLNIKPLATLFFLLMPILTSAKNSMPDNVVTEDNVYRYMLSDTRKAETIMHELRERKKMEEWELDYLEGDLYYNTRRSFKALTFYTKVLNSRQARSDASLQMDILHRMISCYDEMHNENRKSQCIQQLMQTAKKNNDLAMQAVALFNLGKSQYEQGCKAKGYKHMERAAAVMAKTRYKNKFDNLRFQYNTLLIYYLRDGKGSEALRTLERIQNVVTASTGKEKSIDGLDEKEQKTLLAQRTVVFNALGKDKEADDCYRQFRSISTLDSHDDHIIMPYLFKRKCYSEIFRINHAREKELKASGDTINYLMTTIRRDLARAYNETGKYREAARNYELLAILRDSIKNREQQGNALELAELYETNKKDEMLHDRQTLNILLLSIATIALALLAIAFYRTRSIKKRNKRLASLVMDSLQYRNDLDNAREENLHLRELLNAQASEHSVNNQTQKATENSVQAIQDAEKPEDNQKTADSSAETEASGNDNDRHRFFQMLHKVTSEEIYLMPHLTKKDLQEQTGYPAYLVASAFRRYTGLTMSAYITRLRMEHAAKLLLENPNYSIDAIAQMCGMESRQYFHRCFMDCFGITPTAFRSSQK